MNARYLLALLLPFVALAVQWALWPWIAPFVWFLFFPAVFFSARVGGLYGGIGSSMLSAAIVWYVFIPPQFSWRMSNPANAYSVVVFLVMGYLFSETHERLRAAQRDAEQALRDTQAANEKVTRLYQKTLELDELKSHFFANISHELRTPLTLIMSPLNRRLSSGAVSGAQQREDEMMLRNARLLYRHVCDLLDVAKLESGNMAMDYARVELSNLVRSLAAQFDSLAAEKNISFGVTVPDAVTLEADQEKLQRILLNLLANAFKFTPNGGHIALRVATQEQSVRIEVQDDGPGIPETQRAVIFERFRQVEGGAQRRFGGTGLGLAIVREYVQLHGGEVLVDEAPMGGALFTVVLPRAAPAGTVIESLPTQIDALIDYQAVEAQSPVVPIPRHEVAQPRQIPFVLVVEDNADMNAFIADLLQPHYQVASAFDGEDGLAQAKTLMPDLIISDIMMPRMSGDAMIAELRRLPALRDIPVIVLTAKADDALRLNLFKNGGAQGYVNKPFAVDELMARVSGLLHKRKQERDALRLADKRFADIVLASSDWIWETDQAGRYTYVSDNVESIIGKTPEALLGKTIMDVIPDEQARQVAARFDAVMARREAFRDVELVIQHANGQLRFVQTTGMPYLDAAGTFAGYRGLGRDVTTQHQASKRLMDSEERLHLALEATGDGILDWDIEADQLWLAGRVYGEEVGSGTVSAVSLNEFKKAIHPEDLPAVELAITAHLEGNEPACVFDYRVQGDAIEPQWFRFRGRVVDRDAAGHPCRLIATVADISTQKATERALKRQAEALALQNSELERFNRATVRRELDIVDLKRQINSLSLQLGLGAPYPLAFAESATSSEQGATA